ncbi:M20/M25/M40 family metallo-hydrolase [Candidatus Woesearchaeota archaeon]|nr:M20/M25/M40 family metallo-hydrolase [Candidatus Woesearchaeota archaeon]
MNPIELTKELIKIESSDNCIDIANYIGKIFSGKGFKIIKQDVDERGYNLIIKKGDPKLVFFCHMDTVKADKESWTKEPFSGITEKDKLYGLGSSDMKSGIAAAICSVINENTENIMLVFDIGEETDLKGVKKFIDENVKFNPELVVFPECTNMKIIGSNNGCIEIEIIASGKSAHASTPEQGIDAGKLYNVVEELKEEINKFKGSTLNLGFFKAGNEKNINCVPDKARATIDIRPTSELYKEGIPYIKKIILKLLKKYNLNLVNFNIKSNLEPFNTDKSEIERLEKAFKICNIDVVVDSAKFYTEAGIIKSRYKCPCVNVGPGEIDKAHRPDEFVKIENIIKCEKIFSELVKSFN